MLRIVLFLLLIALAATGAAWVADQSGSVTLILGNEWKISATLQVFAVALGLLALVSVVIARILGEVWRVPGRLRRARHRRHSARSRHAITQGLLAVGHGDVAAARQHAEAARRHAPDDPLTLLLHAQSAQLEGDRDKAQHAFRALAERPDTRLLGLRGLFVEAQRADDVIAAALIAEEAIRLSPSSTWASQAVLGFRCARNDWGGALAILDANLEAGLIEKAAFRRQRGVLLTARALDLETRDRDVARASVMEAVRLAPTLVPAAVLAAKFESEAHQVRRAMKLVEAAWVAQPHPDLAEAYAHVRLGDSAQERLRRTEALAEKTEGHVEAALAIARMAIDAGEFARAREVLVPLVEDPTQRVALLMAEIERGEGDNGRARAWTVRAVRARHDPAWTADGYVSEQWRPVSPVTGRIDAFRWQTPVASLSSHPEVMIVASSLEADMAEPVRAPIVEARELPEPQPVCEPVQTLLLEAVRKTEGQVPLQQDNVEPEVVAEAEAAPKREEPAPKREESEPEPKREEPPTVAPPLFRARPELNKPRPIPAAIIPIIRAPDDPGIDEDGLGDEYSDQIGVPRAQAGGWRGFLSRWGG
ncbi:MAG: hypothetical protein FWD68_16360 [Alphaproteobacteria bacterium]|nr:hypothetical protein [Alphaproteobacteria bacterium]